MASYELWAIDASGQQACAIERGNDGERWFLLSGDTDWWPMPLRDEVEAAHWLYSVSAVRRDARFPSLEALIAAVRAEGRFDAVRTAAVPRSRSPSRTGQT